LPVELRKRQKISLKKPPKTEDKPICVNLNWAQAQRAVDLDLGCLYELKDGRRYCVQALGNLFGDLDNPPYIKLDQDDRTGESRQGEFLYINGKHISDIKRILVYAFIYEGAASWQQAQAWVTVSCPGNEDLLVRLDEYDPHNKLCAIAMLENTDDSGFNVEKLVSFHADAPHLDQAYNWGLRWKQGRKD